METTSRHELEKWPYDYRYILDTLDPELIEKHGEALLSRALNIGRVIGFTGSGISMVYGRVSWSQLVIDQVNNINDEVERHFTGKTPEQRQASDPIIFTLHQTLNGLELSKENRRVQADRFPMAFQLCEQLSQELAARNPLGNETSKAVQAGRFRRDVKALSYNDYGQARQIIGEMIDDTHWDALDEKLKPLTDAQLTRNVENDHSSSIVYHFFRSGIVRELSQKSPNRRMAELLAEYAGSAERDSLHAGTGASTIREPIAPLRRFALVALARLAGDREYVENLVVRTLAEAKGAAPNPVRASLPKSSDPLRLMSEELGVWRFLTTNYDLEIERWMASEGYKLTDRELFQGNGNQSSRRDSYDALGNRFTDIVITPQSAADLVDFATRARLPKAQLVHLHGRSTADSEIVVTEHDYKRLYLNDDGDRDLLDDAISLTFGANPLLFVGLGMGEDDILRPLRYFMTEAAPLGNRLAVANPAGKQQGKRDRREDCSFRTIWRLCHPLWSRYLRSIGSGSRLDADRVGFPGQAPGMVR